MRPIVTTIITWLITTFAGAAFFAIIIAATGNGSSTDLLGGAFGAALLIGGGCSIPGMALFHIWTFYGPGKPIARLSWKANLSVVAALIVVRSMMLFFKGGTEGSILFLVLVTSAAYLLPFIACIYMFYPAQADEPAEPVEPEGAGALPAFQPATNVVKRAYIGFYVLAAYLVIGRAAELWFAWGLPTGLAYVSWGQFISELLWWAVLTALLWQTGRRRKWGWALLVFWLAPSVLTLVYQLFIFSAQVFTGWNALYFRSALPLLAEVAVLVLVNTNAFYGPLHMSATFRRRTRVVAVATGLIVFLGYFFQR